MKDIVNSFKAHMYERTSSPLLGAFIFYWIIFNYKFLIVLFSDLKPIEKFNEISSNVYPTELEQYGYGIIFPIIITLVYILIFPIISNRIHKIWIKHQNQLKEISNGKVLTKKEFGELQQKFTELELSFDDKFHKKDSEILKLKSSIEKKDTLIFEYQSKIDSFEKTIHTKDEKINSLENDINNYHIELNKNKEKVSNLQEEIKKLKPNINKLEEEAMKLYIPNYKETFTLEEIENKLNINELKCKYLIKSLKGKGLIEDGNKIDFRGQHVWTIKLSDKGENFLVENNYID